MLVLEFDPMLGKIAMRLVIDRFKVACLPTAVKMLQSIAQ